MKVEPDSGLECCGFRSSQYDQKAIKNVEDYLENNNRPMLKKKCKSPWPYNYRPEIDASLELPLDELSYYQSVIGSL